MYFFLKAVLPLASGMATRCKCDQYIFFLLEINMGNKKAKFRIEIKTSCYTEKSTDRKFCPYLKTIYLFWFRPKMV